MQVLYIEIRHIVTVVGRGPSFQQNTRISFALDTSTEKSKRFGKKTNKSIASWQSLRGIAL